MTFKEFLTALNEAESQEDCSSINDPALREQCEKLRRGSGDEHEPS